MKIAEKETPVVTYGTTSQAEFKIKTSRKSFEILSSGLYANKIAAVVRELSTNAYDSHVAAGCPSKPFIVHAPSKWEPWFSVQDFGTGLSPEKTVSTYTTYFESDKTDSNDFTGALGLGSKSPFCYTDSFSVTSVYDGVRTTFTAFLNQQGTPTLAETHKEDTTDGNGVTVQVPVAEKDINEFCRQCADVLRWFKVRPEIEGGQVHFLLPQSTYLSTDWCDIGEQRAGVEVELKLIMGNVCYPIEGAHIARKAFGTDYSLTLYAEIGDVDVTASREALQYTHKTIAYVKAASENAYQELLQKINDEAAACPNLWSFRVWLCYNNDRLEKIGLRRSITYNGVSYASYVDVPIENYDETSSVAFTVLRWDSGRRHTNLKQQVPRITPKLGTVIVVLDGDRRQTRYDRAGLEMIEAGYGSANIYIVSPEDYSKPTFADWIVQNGLGDRIRHAADWEIPKAERPKQLVNTAPKISWDAFRFDIEGKQRDKPKGRKYWSACNLSSEKIAAGGYFVILNNYRIDTEDAGLPPFIYSLTYGDSFRSYLRLVFPKGIPEIYGVRKSDAARFIKSGWVNVFDARRDVLNREKKRLEKIAESRVRGSACGNDEIGLFRTVLYLFDKFGIDRKKVPTTATVDLDFIEAAMDKHYDPVDGPDYRCVDFCRFFTSSAGWVESSKRTEEWAKKFPRITAYAVTQLDASFKDSITKALFIEALKKDVRKR